MSKVFTALSVSVDGYITGRDPGPGHGLGDAGFLFDWYFNGDVASRAVAGFRLSEASAVVFDDLAARVGAVVCGRNTYDDSEEFGGGSPVEGAPLVVLSHRPAARADESDRQTLVTTGIEDVVAMAREQAGDKDVALQGGGVITEALKAGLLDEFVLHQLPVLLGAGRPYFQELPQHVNLLLLHAIPAPGVTHLHYEVIR